MHGPYLTNKLPTQLFSATFAHTFTHTLATTQLDVLFIVHTRYSAITTARMEVTCSSSSFHNNKKMMSSCVLACLLACQEWMMMSFFTPTSTLKRTLSCTLGLSTNKNITKNHPMGNVNTRECNDVISQKNKSTLEPTISLWASAHHISA